ncbi:dipeptidyl carboxypeptidase II [Steroidobacter denitrificans]|uniref:Dipeptidyl carboxypeptidase n=2 Tax=Steroidobacter denitrificans TaxID=465721 RepID=A0A127F609_STEDE|nr:dipeptidyl carboxypeptidase II [Steroidobacter denitrificans]
MTYASTTTTTTTTLPSDNPFARESTLPYQLPPLDRIKNEHFKPALIAGMAQQREEIAAITANPAAPSFENTILAMERSGRLLTRVQAVFENLAAANTNPVIEDVQSWAAAPIAAHTDAIFLDPALYARVHDLYERRATLGLDAESLRLLERYETLFVRAGARLSDTDKETLKQLNEQLSSSTTEFRRQVLNGVNAAAIVVDSRAELDGLTDEQIAVAAEAAKARGMPGKWVIALLNTTGQPPLSQLTSRALRERIFRASIGRGWGGTYDTTGLVAQIVKLRAERAALLGYANHAAYVLEDETAGTTGAVDGMLKQLAPPAMANAKKEAAVIQQLIDRQAAENGTESFRLEAWDWDFHAEQVRKAQFAYDEAEVRPYFEMERVLRDGVLFAATELFGITFKERTDLPTYHEDVRVFEVFDADGSTLGLFMADWYARSNKRGGAWMSTFVDQSRLLGTRPVVINNLNVPKPPAGQPTLLTFDEVTTAFHEFGHALHSLFSDVAYPLFSGTNVPRDFVEYPSQYNEMWAIEPRVLANYAKHHRTGAAMPQSLMDKVLAASKFNQGYGTTEYLASAMLDQAWHQLPAGKTPPQSAVEKFEAAALQAAGMDFPPVPPRYRSTYFSHIFASPIGYSSGYYAYIWSEVLAADTVHWFKTHGGLTRAGGQHLRQKILSKGFSADMLTIFEDFYGQRPDIVPLLESRGLTGGGSALEEEKIPST